MSATVVFSPAKINLFLAITGRRADGFHNLVSVVAPLAWGDALHVELITSTAAAAEAYTLTCDDPAVPCDETNLVLKAAGAFQQTTGWPGQVRFHLEKRIPIGAGLGGGSSNAAAALQALNRLAGSPLSPAALAAVAAKVGSDCALFLHGGPVVMRGRGELVSALPAWAAKRLSGRRVLVFKPSFGISTPWAYRQLAKQADGQTATDSSVYYSPEAAEARLAAWLHGGEPAEILLFNHLEQVAFTKFIALPALLEELTTKFGLLARMSGSGSACFVLLPADASADAMIETIKAAWGPNAFVMETSLA